MVRGVKAGDLVTLTRPEEQSSCPLWDINGGAANEIVGYFDNVQVGVCLFRTSYSHKGATHRQSRQDVDEVLVLVNDKLGWVDVVHVQAL